MAESEAVARDLQPGAIAIVDSPSIRTSAVCPLTPIPWGWCGRTRALEQLGWEFMFVLPSFATRTVYFTFQQLKPILDNVSAPRKPLKRRLHREHETFRQMTSRDYIADPHLRLIRFLRERRQLNGRRVGF